MQNFNQHSDELYSNHNQANNPFTNSGQGNLPGQNLNLNNQPTIIRPEAPKPMVEQVQTFEKPRPASPQQRSLRPQQTQQRTTVTGRTNPQTTTKPIQSKDEQIKAIFEEIETLKTQTKKPGALTRIEKLLKQILDINS